MFSNKNEKGIMSLAVIFVVGFFGLGLALTIATIALVGLNKNYNTNSGNQTFYTAEAAAREGIYQYLSTTSYSGGPIPADQLINGASEGIIAVTTSTLGVAHREVIGTAKNNLTNRKVSYTLVFSEALAFEYAIFSASNISLGGNSSINGNTFSNGDTTLGGSANIDGDAFATGTITGCNPPSCFKNENADPIDFPEININFNQYKTEAENNPAEPGGTRYTNANTLENYLKNNNRTGVIFASTTALVLIIGNNTYLSGSLVTLGDLTINNGEFVSTVDHEAIVVAGDFEINGGEIIGNIYVEGDFKPKGGKITGIVYVKGITNGVGNPIINGAVISRGGITINTTGCPTCGIIYNPDILADWFEFGGFGSTITTPPKIVSWQEQ